MSNYLAPFGTVNVTVPSGEAVAVFSQGKALVERLVGAPNYPTMSTVVGSVSNGQLVTSNFTPGTTIVITAVGGLPVLYEVGVAPVVKQQRLLNPVQATPGVLNATATLTPALALTGLITSTTAAAVTAQLDTGANWELAADWDVNEALQWSVVNTGATNAFTVTTAASGNTLVGSGTVAASSSATFRTVRTAASTFTTYRI